MCSVTSALQSKIFALVFKGEGAAVARALQDCCFNISSFNAHAAFCTTLLLSFGLGSIATAVILSVGSQAPALNCSRSRQL
jgi:hypothetical protein